MNLQTTSPPIRSWLTAMPTLFGTGQSAPVDDAIQKKRTQLLSSMLLVLAIALAFILYQVWHADPNDVNNLGFQVGTLLIGIYLSLYAVNYWGYINTAILLFSAITYILMTGIPIWADAPGLLPMTLIPVIIIGIFYHVRVVIVAALLTLVITYTEIQSIGSSNSDYWQMRQTWYFLIAASVLIITFIRHLNILERIRQGELRAANSQLKTLANSLEQQVEVRTEELRVAKLEAEDARDRALEADRVKSQFLANMSHELRTPLNAILNFTAFVSDGVLGEVNPEQRDALQMSISSSKHLLSLINDVLDITKIEAGLMDLFIQEVDLNEILASTVSVGKGLVKDKPVKLLDEIQPQLPCTYGDKRRLRQVLLNVISNAVKFTPSGSVTIRAACADNVVKISVQDTGIGIAPADHALVFESFKQAKHNLQDTVGTGLGMPISKYFVESHGGKIWLESELGSGTTFHVELPVLTDEQANKLAFGTPE